MDDLSWGRLSLRGRANVLAGAVGTPDGDRCAAEFLLFDTKEVQLIHCRYAEGHAPRCRTRPLQPWEDEEDGEGGPEGSESCCLWSPRQLLLSPQRRLFASLEVRAGAARVAVWRLIEGADGPDSYALVAPVGVEGVASARALAWLPPESAALAEEGGGGEGGGDGGAGAGPDLGLAVLLAREVALLRLVERRGLWAIEPGRRLQLGFQASCLCWSADGTQLLVGGAGQLACFVFAGRGAAPEVRHCLCAGDCADVQPAYASAFLCRIDQKAGGAAGGGEGAGAGAGAAAAEPSLLLPGGRRLPWQGASAQGPAGLGGSLVVEVDNPQDAAPSEPPLVTGAGLGAAGALAAGGGLLAAEAVGSLQVVPQRRYLLPLRCETGAASGSSGGTPGAGGALDSRPRRRVRCGAELEASGEALAVLSPEVPGQGRNAVVAEGSFDGSCVKVWELAPPFRWTSVSSPWRALREAELLPAAAGPQRLRGLALWQGAKGTELHAALAEANTSILDRTNARELQHCTRRLESKSAAEAALAASAAASSSVLEAAREPAPGGPTAGARAPELAGLAGDVAGIRGELRAMRESFEAFAGDFRRMTGAIEALAAAAAAGARKTPAESG